MAGCPGGEVQGWVTQGGCRPVWMPMGPMLIVNNEFNPTSQHTGKGVQGFCLHCH